jgi:hypothetical protein
MSNVTAEPFLDPAWRMGPHHHLCRRFIDHRFGLHFRFDFWRWSPRVDHMECRWHDCGRYSVRGLSIGRVF